MSFRKRHDNGRAFPVDRSGVNKADLDSVVSGDNARLAAMSDAALHFEPNVRYQGRDYAMFRTVKNPKIHGKDEIFVDSNVYIGKNATGDMSLAEAKKAFEAFKKQYGVVGLG